MIVFRNKILPRFSTHQITQSGSIIIKSLSSLYILKHVLLRANLDKPKKNPTLNIFFKNNPLVDGADDQSHAACGKE